MPRPPKDEDATQNLKPEDETQTLRRGRRSGYSRARKCADFKKIARGNDSES